MHVNFHVRPGLFSWVPGGTWGAPLYAFSVPTFFLLAGRFAGAGSGPPTWAAVGRRVRRMLPPFLTWNAALIGLGVLGEPGLPDALFWLLTGAWQLYFLFAWAQLQALSAWLEPRLAERGVRWAVAGALLATTATYAISDVLLWRYGLRSVDVEPLAERSPFTWAGFWSLGVALRRLPAAEPALARAWPALAVAAVPTWLAYAGALQRQDAAFGVDVRQQVLLGGLPFQLLATLAFVGACERLGRTRAGAWAARAAPDTMGIYLVHTAVLSLGYGALRRWGWTWVGASEVAVVAMGTWLVSHALVHGLRTRAPPWVARWWVGAAGRAPSGAA